MGSQRVGHDSNMACTQWTKFFSEIDAVLFSVEKTGVSLLHSAPPLLTRAFVLLEVNFPRNTTQGGAIAFMLNQLQAQPPDAICRFHLESVKQVPKAERESFCMC